MKNLVLSLVFVSIVVSAQKKAVTDEGDVVLLNDNGTWTYQSKKPKKAQEIITNNENFNKASDLNFNIKSKVNNFEIWINPKKWSFEKSSGSDATEYSFRLKNEDLFGMAITEKLPIEMKYLSDIAFENAKAAAPDAKIINREIRMVNGKQVIFMQMQATMSGIDFTYLGYYFSDDNGSTQLVVYTGTSFLDKYRNQMIDFLNGFG